ncbi:MAG: hypothetical protein AAF558_02345 [Verrucomicrobiota bacterium]
MPDPVDIAFLQYRAYPLNHIPDDQLTNCLGSADQGNEGVVVAKFHNNGDYVSTGGFTACTAFSIFDRSSRVVSIAHFDGSETPAVLTKMVDDMVKLGANLHHLDQWGIVAAAIRENTTLRGVWDCIDERLRPIVNPLPPLNQNDRANPTLIDDQIYYGRSLCVGYIHYAITVGQRDDDPPMQTTNRCCNLL